MRLESASRPSASSQSHCAPPGSLRQPPEAAGSLRGASGSLRKAEVSAGRRSLHRSLSQSGGEDCTEVAAGFCCLLLGTYSSVLDVIAQYEGQMPSPPPQRLPSTITSAMASVWVGAFSETSGAFHPASQSFCVAFKQRHALLKAPQTSCERSPRQASASSISRTKIV